MKGWAYSDLVIRRERDHWFAQDHTGEGHGLVSREEYLRSRRRRR